MFDLERDRAREHIKRFVSTFKTLTGLLIPIVFLKVSVIASVLPYAWVNDTCANWGAKNALKTQSSDLFVLAALAFSAYLIFAFIVGGYVLIVVFKKPWLKELRLSKLVWSRLYLLFSAFCGWVILLCFVMLFNDLHYLNNIPEPPHATADMFLRIWSEPKKIIDLPRDNPCNK